MGITIHYRGTMDDVGQVESLEDRVLDFVYSMGGRATIWRSFDDHDSSRVVRGLMIELEPGHDTFSLLISPEGDLTPLKTRTFWPLASNASQHWSTKNY